MRVLSIVPERLTGTGPLARDWTRRRGDQDASGQVLVIARSVVGPTDHTTDCPDPVQRGDRLTSLQSSPLDCPAVASGRAVRVVSPPSPFRRIARVTGEERTAGAARLMRATERTRGSPGERSSITRERWKVQDQSGVPRRAGPPAGASGSARTAGGVRRR